MLPRRQLKIANINIILVSLAFNFVASPKFFLVGRKIAIDASMCLYQFLIAVRADNGQLSSEDGETTSHLLGFFYRTIRMIENGIKPVYVFDGKPPELKLRELKKRQERRNRAQHGLVNTTDTVEIDRFNRRLVKVDSNHVDEVKMLLSLMGVPFIQAPGEAEAQCAALVKSGQVFATATEDMDALAFGSNILLRHLTFSESRKIPVQEIHLNKVLEGLNLQQKEFVDLCILLGCDYADTIKGIGPKKATELIKEHRTIDAVLAKADPEKKSTLWDYEPVRQLFYEPEVLPAVALAWTSPDEDGIIKFLCGKQFNEVRVRNGIKRLKSRNNSTQGRLDGFVKVLYTTPAKFVCKKETHKKRRGKK